MGCVEPGKSQNLFLLGTSDGGAYVLKTCMTVVENYFATLLYQKLKLPCPDVLLLQYKEQEYVELCETVDRVTRKDERLKMVTRQALDMPFLLVYEYIPCLHLTRMTQTDAKLCLDTALKDGRERLIDIGRIVAADIFVNNSERLPLLWEKEVPNTDNLLFEVDTRGEETVHGQPGGTHIKRAIAAIQTINCFNSDTKVGQMNKITYLNRIEQFLESIFTDLKHLMKPEADILTYSFSTMSTFRTFFMDFTEYDIGPMGCLEILLGIIIGFYNIVGMDIGTLTRIRTYVSQQLLKDWKDVWVKGMNNINISFLTETYELIKHHMTLNLECVEWALRVSFHKGVVDVFDDNHESQPIAHLEIDDSYDLDAINQGIDYSQRRMEESERLNMKQERENRYQGEEAKWKEEMDLLKNTEQARKAKAHQTVHDIVGPRIQDVGVKASKGGGDASAKEDKKEDCIIF